MPSPLCVGPIAIAASKKTALHAAATSCTISSYDVGVASTAITAYVLVRLAWNRIPEWIKNDVAVQNLMKGKVQSDPSTDDNVLEFERDLATLSSVIDKLQLLLTSGVEKVQKHQEEPVEHLHVAFLLYIQLAAQLRRLYPHQRNGWYERSGSSSIIPSCRIDRSELREAFDWSVLAYEADSKDLKAGLGGDFEVIQHNSTPSSPGEVGHFVAASRNRRLVVIGIKGTSSFEDFLTDCCGRSVTYQESRCVGESVEVSASGPDAIEASDAAIEVTSGHERIMMQSCNDGRIHCHEGVLLSAQRLADMVEAVIGDLLVLKEYRCIVCGHSLGAGVAALLGLILRGRFPQLVEADRILRVYSFAPPPILDYESSLSTSSYIVSIVNDSDFIARSSLANLVVFIEFLRHVSTKLVERGLSPNTTASAAALLQKLAKGTNDDDVLMTMEEVEQARECAYNSVPLNDPHHLYIPGRVLVFYDRHNVGHSGDLRNDPPEDFAFLDTNGACEILRFFELDGSMLFKPFSDHVCASYSKSLDQFCAT